MSDTTSRAGPWLDRVLGASAALILMAMMLLTAVDVVSRYIFNWPLRGAFEVTELMLLTLIFAGLPLASRADEHVSMDFIDLVMGPSVRRGYRRFIEFVMGVVVLALAWQVYIKAGKIESYGDTTDVLQIPVAPFVYFMCAMVVLTGLVHIAKAFVPARSPAAHKAHMPHLPEPPAQ